MEVVVKVLIFLVMIYSGNGVYVFMVEFVWIVVE